MRSQETTKKKARSASEIDFREIGEISRKAKEGDKVAKAEIKKIAQAIKDSGLDDNFSKLISDQTNDEISGFAQDIVKNYIDAFNRINETSFDSLDQIEDYLKGKEKSSEVDFEEIVETTVIHPKDFTHTLGRLTEKVFSNELTLQKGQSGKKRRVTLDGDKKVSVYVSVDYDKVLSDFEKIAKIPELTEDGRQVIDGIVSNFIAGNRIMTYNMIYRGFSGDMNSRRLPLGVFEMISEALLSFRGWLKIEDNGSNKRTTQSYNEPLLMYRQYEESESVIINGKEVKGGEGIIEVFDLPTIYRFAQANGNEIDSRDIKLLNVPKVNNTPENLKLKRYLYHRVIVMRNNYERRVLQKHKSMSLSRKILFSSIFEYIGASGSDRKRKYKIVQKIESILDYWKDFGLIEGYTKTRKAGSNEVDGVEINFVKKLEEKKQDSRSSGRQETTEGRGGDSQRG